MRVPEGWRSGCLEDVVSLQRGHDLPESERTEGSIPIVSAAGKIGFHNKCTTDGPGIVIGRSGSGFGNVHYCNENFWAHNTGLYVTDFKGNSVNYVFYLLKSLNFSSYNSGGVQPSLNRNFIYPIKLNIPPLPEQQKIAQIISTWDKAIEILEALIAAKQKRKKALMQQLLTGKKRFAGFEGEWKKLRFEQFVSLGNEKFEPNTKSVHRECIELEHIQQCTGILNGTSKTEDKSSIKSVFKVKNVLFGKLRPYLRKYWLSDREGVCSTEIWVLQAKEKLATPEYIFQLVQTTSFIDSTNISSGTHMPRADWAVVKDSIYRLPSISEQQKIASVLSAADTEIETHQKQLAALKQQKKGLMQQLLTGKKRVNVDGDV
jgi:type I restriction enzyme, S subunit